MCKLTIMRIARLRISGFRGIQSADLQFGPHTVLVGPNNVGKTTVIEALALLLGRDRLLRSLTEHDFFGSSPTEESRISVIATVTGFDRDEPNSHREWFSKERGVEKWLDTTTGELFPARKTGTALAVQIGFAARFNVDTLEVETVRFFVDDEDDIGDPFDEDSHLHPVRGRTLQEFGFFLVPATRTWDRWMSFASELFRKVVAATGGMPAEAIRQERQALWQPAIGLEDSKGIKEIVSRINDELKHLMSTAPQLRLRITSTDSEGVLEAIVPHFSSAGGSPLPSSRQGAGLASLQSLLLLMQFGAARKAKGECFVLAVEEPELHVQPSQQKRLVNRLNAVCAQTVMTTHSPMVASMFPPQDMIFMRNISGKLTGERLNVGASTESTNHEQHLLFAWRERLVAALMHEHVLVPEGVSDVAWLEALQNAIELRQDWESVAEGTRFGTFVGIVPTVDAKMADTFTLTQPVHGDVLCLVDGDKDGEHYLKTLLSLSIAPRVIYAWPYGWSIERVIAWLAEADAAQAHFALSSALGAPIGDSDSLTKLLLQRKSYAPTQQIVCQLLAGITSCRDRATELLNDMADIARQSDAKPKHFIVETDGLRGRVSTARLKT